MEEDIKILENKLKQWEPYKNTKFPTPIEKEIQKENRAIENLLNKYREQEKTIELALDCLSVWAMCADDEGCFCTVKGKECNVVANEIEGQEHTTCKECLIDYFKKKARGE